MVTPAPAAYGSEDVYPPGVRSPARRAHDGSVAPTSEAPMQHSMNGFNGFMGGYGLWTILGVLAAIFLIVAIFKMVQKK
jgi:hypothetical protein